MKASKVFTLLLSFLLKSIILFGQQGQWTWMKGDTTFNSPGHYGVQGVADPANNPPALFGANGWVDQQGNFWLFGGSMGWNIYNDLWKYDVALNMWTWVKGPGIPYQHAVYGTQGIPADSNLPKCRGIFTTWVDILGNFWLFGGADGMGKLNDLWRYQPSNNQWTWMKGPPDSVYYAHYGTVTVPSPENNPPPRTESNGGWVDNNGDLWMFGGYKSIGAFSDVWRYNISSNTWTWMAGSDSTLETPVYGIQNVPSFLNTTGARASYGHWQDSEGNFWLFGGTNGSIQNINIYNDLWMFNPLTLQWTWISGTYIPGAPASCQQGPCIPLTQNAPESRLLVNSCWKGICDYFYLYGGYGLLAKQKSDLWCYNKLTHEWTFAKGSLDTNNQGFHGIMGLPGPANQPRGFDGSCSWTDLKGNLWFFGGRDSIGFFSDYQLNELWRYTPDTLCPAGQEMATLSISPDTTICFGDTIMITASGGTSYQWSPAINISDLHIPNPLVYPDSSIVYRVKISVNKCYSELYVNIHVNSDSVFSVSPQDTLVCKGDSIMLHTTGGDSVHWQPNNYLSSNSIHNPIVKPDSNITYSVSLSNSCYNQTFTVHLDVVPGTVKKIINQDTLICAGQPVSLQALGGVQYLWNSGQSGDSIIVTPQQQTNYIATITDADGCKKYDSVMVYVNPLPPVQVSATDSMICSGASVQLSASGAIYYKWSSVEWSSDTISSSIIITPAHSNNYKVIGTDLNNCSDSDTITIEVTDCFITIPTVFTPNGDGINDYFLVEYKGPLDYNVRIYNRWGAKLFESHDIKSPWNGKNHEKDVSPGTYYYIVWVGDKEYKGIVTLLR